MRDELFFDVLVEQQHVPVFLQPLWKITFSPENLLVHLHRDLRLLLGPAVSEPVPELRNTAERIVIAVGINQDVRVEQVEQSSDPLWSPCQGRSSLPTCVGLTPRTLAAFVVDRAPESIMRWPKPSRACPTRWRRTT